MATYVPIYGASREQEYIKQIQSEVETINTVDEIDVNPFVLTTLIRSDNYVSRRYPLQKLRGETRAKCVDYGGPCQVTQVL